MSDDLVERLRDRNVCSLAHNSCRNDMACDEAADRIEELEAKGLANRVAIMRLEAKLAKAAKALDGVMVGGNHLATILPNNFPQAETEPLIALETMGYGYDYEVWCCWRSIMLARATLAELTGGKDE